MSAIHALRIKNGRREGIACAQLYAVLSVARTALLLINRDSEFSMYSAFILLRTHLEVLMRAAFIAGPATAKEIEHFIKNDEIPKRGGKRLGPVALAEINSDHYGWTVDKVPSLVRNHWDAMCGFSHGGVATLNFFSSSDELAPMKIADEKVLEVLVNVIALSMLGVAVAMTMSRTSDSPEAQAALGDLNQKARELIAAWSKAIDSAAAPA